MNRSAWAHQFGPVGTGSPRRHRCRSIATARAALRSGQSSALVVPLGLRAPPGLTSSGPPAPLDRDGARRVAIWPALRPGGAPRAGACAWARQLGPAGTGSPRRRRCRSIAMARAAGRSGQSSALVVPLGLRAPPGLASSGPPAPLDRDGARRVAVWPTLRPGGAPRASGSAWAHQLGRRLGCALAPVRVCCRRFPEVRGRWWRARLGTCSEADQRRSSLPYAGGGWLLFGHP